MDGRTTALRLIREGRAGLLLDRQVDWKSHGTGWRFSAVLRTELSSRIVICMSILGPESLYRPTILLRDDGPSPNNLVRLDVRAAPHKNRLTDGAVVRGTHIHYWRAGVRDAHADPPGHTWPPPGVDERVRQEGADDLETIFEWFCTTHHVVLGGHYGWQAPPPGEELKVLTTPEGDEIP